MRLKRLIPFLVLICSFVSCAPDISRGLIAHYPFNGSADNQTRDDLHGIVHGARLTADRKNKPNAAYMFDGVDDYIQVKHDEVLNLPEDFTISLWTKISSDQVPHSGINDILRKWTGNAEGYPFSISYLNSKADEGKQNKIICVRYDSQLCRNSPTTFSPVIANDRFIHIVLVKEGGRMKHYVNKKLVEEITDTTNPARCKAGNSADMTIGCRGNLVRFFRGVIDDVRIYERALTQKEINTVYRR